MQRRLLSTTTSAQARRATSRLLSVAGARSPQKSRAARDGRSSVLTGGQGGGAPSHRVTLRRGDCFGTAVLEAIFKGGDRATSIDIPASPEGRGSYALIDGSVGGRGKYRCTGKSLGTVVVLELRRGNLRSAKATEENQIPLSILESVNESASKSLKDFLNLASVQRLRLLCGMPARTIKEGHALEPEVLFESSGAEDKPAAGMEVSEKVSHHTKVVQVVIKGMVTAETAVEGEGEAEESKPLEWGDCVDEEALVRPCKKSLKSPKGDSAIVELDADMLIAMSGLMSTVARRSDAESVRRPQSIRSRSSNRSRSLALAAMGSSAWSSKSLLRECLRSRRCRSRMW